MRTLPEAWADLIRRIASGVAGVREAEVVRSMVEQVLELAEQIGPGARPPVTGIIAHACALRGVSRAAALGADRTAGMAALRQAVVLVALAAGRSTSEIARALRRDRATVLHAARRARGRLSDDVAFRELVRTLAAQAGVVLPPEGAA